MLLKKTWSKNNTRFIKASAFLSIFFVILLAIASPGCKMRSDQVEEAARTWITALAGDNYERFCEMTKFEDLILKKRSTGKEENIGVTFNMLDTEEKKEQLRSKVYKVLREQMHNNHAFFNAVDMKISRTAINGRQAKLGFNFKKDPQRHYYFLKFWQNFTTKDWFVDRVEF